MFAIFLTQMSSLAPYTPLGASYATSDPNTNAAFFATYLNATLVNQTASTSLIRFGTAPAYFNTTGVASPYYIRFVRPTNETELQQLREYEAMLAGLHAGIANGIYDQFMDSHLGVFLIDKAEHTKYVQRLRADGVPFLVRCGEELPGFASVFAAAPSGLVVEVSGYSDLPAVHWDFCSPTSEMARRWLSTAKQTPHPLSLVPQIWKMTLQSSAPVEAQAVVNEILATRTTLQPHAKAGANGTCANITWSAFETCAHPSRFSCVYQVHFIENPRKPVGSLSVRGLEQLAGRQWLKNMSDFRAWGLQNFVLLHSDGAADLARKLEQGTSLRYSASSMQVRGVLRTSVMLAVPHAATDQFVVTDAPVDDAAAFLLSALM